MTEEQTIDLGLKAEHLMNDAAYQELFDITVNQMSMQILATSVEQKEQREQFYLTVHGLRAFNNLINSYRTAKDEIVARRNEENEQREDD